MFLNLNHSVNKVFDEALHRIDNDLFSCKTDFQINDDKSRKQHYEEDVINIDQDLDMLADLNKLQKSHPVCYFACKHDIKKAKQQFKIFKQSKNWDKFKELINIKGTIDDVDGTMRWLWLLISCLIPN